MVIDGDACTIVLPPDAEDPDLSRFLSAAELICEESIRGQGAA